MNGEIDHILFEDECMIRAYQSLHYNWFPVGHQRKIPTYGQHQGAKLFGALNFETGQVHYRDGVTYDAPAFIRFLEFILQEFPTGNIVIILDNGRIHHAAQILLPDDEGGHLIASIFKGSGDLDNLVPMNGNLNKGEWKKFENTWADALKQGDEVKVKITPNYKGDSQRPVSFDIKYKIGDNDWEIRQFDNVPGGK
ncbi:DNA/RNA non-specific endonuclease [Paenibacillus jiagnxiensis]|uniref:DNA/RNA non-specific endonuclease n=1 Tax=Paenibacillus jiagnxiensis TaxID=3228926 RepID=UPI0038D50414